MHINGNPPSNVRRRTLVSGRRDETARPVARSQTNPATRDALGSQTLWAQLAGAGPADSQGVAGIRTTLDALGAQVAETTRRYASMRAQYLRY